MTQNPVSQFGGELNPQGSFRFLVIYFSFFVTIYRVYQANEM